MSGREVSRPYHNIIFIKAVFYWTKKWAGAADAAPALFEIINLW